MSGLTAIERVLVPVAAARRAQDHLRWMGQRGSEGFALWAGVVEGATFSVLETVIPVQRGVRADDGICVVVDGSELHRINRWLYEQGMTLIAQLHSHPGEAYHSATDDTFPIATAVGSLSLVVPDFARNPFSLERCAVYRLAGDGSWIELSDAETRALIAIEG